MGQPLRYLKASVWASNNKYYIDGKAYSITSAHYKKYSADYIREELEKYKEQNSYEYFSAYIKKFVQANRYRLNYLIDEAFSFIRYAAANYDHERIVISFSGGKDSTVTADLTVRALEDPGIVHIFGNTTLEFPMTVDYANRFRSNNPKTIFKVAKNREQEFYSVCEDIGPPARMMRWCCSMFKTGPITRV